MTAPLIVADAGSFEELCARVDSATRVALDTEFHSERSYAPRLMVVQLAFEDGAAIVDPLAIGDLLPLVERLGRKTVVGHALVSDLKIFADRYGIVPQSVFDTQVAAAFLGYGLQISLADLVRDVQRVRLAKSQTVSDWSARPLTPRQLEYLVDDVAHLLPMHDVLRDRLERAGRYEWAMEECAELADVTRYRNDGQRAYLRIPGSTRMNRRELAALNEIMALRDRVARERDLPVKYVMPDDVVSGLATLRPKRIDDLVQLRRLDSGMRRQLGPAILAAIARAEALDECDLPEKPKRPLGGSRDTLAALLAVVVGEIAAEAGLPANLLVPRAALDRVAREIPRDRETFEHTLALRPWRLELIADPLWRLLSGDAALSIEGYADGNPKVRFSHDECK